jgi:hypothetical protein
MAAKSNEEKWEWMTKIDKCIDKIMFPKIEKTDASCKELEKIPSDGK